MRPDDKRQRILAAATAVFAERDFHRVLVSEVASRARVGKGTVYLYFPTKDHLHRVALEASLEGVAAEVERAAEAEAPAEAVLREIVVSILRFFWRRPHLLTLVVRYEQRHTRPASDTPPETTAARGAPTRCASAPRTRLPSGCVPRNITVWSPIMRPR